MQPSPKSQQFFVEAYDDGLPVLATSASININVLDVNEYAPEVITETLFVVENHVVGKGFGRIVAADRDAQSIRFSLPDSETRFSIDPSSGELSSLKPGLLDFETHPMHVLHVIVEDTGTPSRSSQSQVAIVVLNADDPPTEVKVSQPLVSTNIAGQNLGTITVVDQDYGQSCVVTSLDSRFVVVQDRLMLAEGAFLGESDPVQFAPPVRVSEVGSPDVSFQLTIQLERTLWTRPWQNPRNRFDVDRNRQVDPLDVLILIDAINGNWGGKLPQPRAASTLSLPDFDVDGDGELTPLDILQLVNELNGQSLGGEGESSSEMGASSRVLEDVSPAIWLSAFNELEETEFNLRRKATFGPVRRDRVTAY